jgi:hypothetical protein
MIIEQHAMAEEEKIKSHKAAHRRTILAAALPIYFSGILRNDFLCFISTADTIVSHFPGVPAYNQAKRSTASA